MHCTCIILHLHVSFRHQHVSLYIYIYPAARAEEGESDAPQVYVLSGVGGSVGTFIFGDAVTVGASSGIFGLIGVPALSGACFPSRRAVM